MNYVIQLTWIIPIAVMFYLTWKMLDTYEKL